jgi:hypothetical protein
MREQRAYAVSAHACPMLGPASFDTVGGVHAAGSAAAIPSASASATDATEEMRGITPA